MSADIGAYSVLCQLGGGAFGTVYKARAKANNTKVALKKVYCSWTREEGHHYQRRNTLNGASSSSIEKRLIPPRVLREIMALKYVRMENIVQLLEVFPCGSHVVLVFEYMPTTLRQVLMHNRLTCAQQKAYSKMILAALEHMHSVHIIHRDLKPENLLISKNGTLKVADFGLCRLVSSSSDMRFENQAGTRHYRAPEVIFGSQSYNERADIWSAGCIFYELMYNQPLLWAEDDIDIAVTMLRLFGLPSLNASSHAAEFREHFPDLFKVTFELPNVPVKPFSSLLPHCDSHFAQLIQASLTFQPWNRSDATDLLKLAVFTADPQPAALNELPDVSKLGHGKRRNGDKP